MATKPVSRLKRARNPMPADIKRALEKKGVWKAYQQRPEYQQNDYLGWIARAKLPPTRLKRVNQMLEELEQGDVYMKMAWKPKR